MGSRISYANVTSTLALALVVGGGTAYATGLGPDSVGTEQLQDGAVTAPKIARGAVRSATVADGSLELTDLATVPVTRTVVRRQYWNFITTPGEDGVVRSRTVLCRKGETVLGGGHDVLMDRYPGGQPNTVVRASRPARDGTGTQPDDGAEPRGWYVKVWRDSGAIESTLSVWVLCGS